jgi:hypothetical protein
MSETGNVVPLERLALGITREHEAVEAAVTSALDHARHAGELLIKAKEQVQHGEWLPWLAANVPSVSVRTAQNYMRIASEWASLQTDGKTQRVASLRSALALLSEPRTNADDAAPGTSPGSGRAMTISCLKVSDIAAPEGWKQEDPVLEEKLVTSIRRYGLLRPVLVRRLADGTHEVVDGRKTLAAAREAGLDEVQAIDLGEIDETEADRVAIAMGLRFRTDYPNLSVVLARLIAGGETPETLATFCRYDAERIGHMDTLTRFDWSQFKSKTDPVTAAQATPENAEEDEAWTEPQFRCPRCNHEWDGEPRPFKFGGAAMQAARDRRNGIRPMRLAYDTDRHRLIAKQTRDLAKALDLPDVAETVAEVVRRAHAELGADRIEARP